MFRFRTPDGIFNIMSYGGCKMKENVLWAFAATVITWAVTALGAATVVFFKKPKEKILVLMLGFSAGVMIAASFWSLLEPAINTASKSLNIPAYFVAAIGFSVGVAFMVLSDKAAAVFNGSKPDHSRKNRVFMLFMSITLHNIPEGLAIGVAFGSIGSGNDEALVGALTLALGIAIQNFPEGAAVSLPLRKEGYSRRKSFMLGQASALVEPIAGVIGAALVVYVKNILPYALAFAAGAMVLVAVHEIIPECQSYKDKSPYLASVGIMAGFLVMMILDVMLG